MRAALLTGLLCLLPGCSEARAERGFQVAAFDRITLLGSPDVVIRVGGAVSVRAEGQAAAVERLDIRVVDGELRIETRPGQGSGLFGWSNRVTVHLTVPSLQAATIMGSGDIEIDRIEGARFAGQVAGSGDLDIAALRVGEASLAVRGSGDLTAAGTAGRADVSVAGSGDLRLSGLEAGDAAVSLQGSGIIALRVLSTAAVQLNGSGDVNITGPARCTVAKTGSGDVRCGG